MSINDIFNIAVQKAAKNLGLDYSFEKFKRSLDACFAESWEQEQSYIHDFKKNDYHYEEKHPNGYNNIFFIDNSEKINAWNEGKTYNSLLFVFNGELGTFEYRYAGYSGYSGWGRSIDNRTLRNIQTETGLSETEIEQNIKIQFEKGIAKEQQISIELFKQEVLFDKIYSPFASKFAYNESIKYIDGIPFLIKNFLLKDGKHEELNRLETEEKLRFQEFIGEKKNEGRSKFKGIPFHTWYDFSLSQYDKIEPVKILKHLKDYLRKENLNELLDVVVNFGKRHESQQARGHSYHTNYQYVDGYKVFENQKLYEFTKKSDCKSINVGYLDIFLLSKKYFVKLSIGAEGVIQRVHQIWKRDVKKIDIYQSVMVEIYFHGYYDPEILVLESYDKALELQRKLMDLRERY